MGLGRSRLGTRVEQARTCGAGNLHATCERPGRERACDDVPSSAFDLTGTRRLRKVLSVVSHQLRWTMMALRTGIPFSGYTVAYLKEFISPLDVVDQRNSDWRAEEKSLLGLKDPDVETWGSTVETDGLWRTARARIGVVHDRVAEGRKDGSAGAWASGA